MYGWKAPNMMPCAKHEAKHNKRSAADAKNSLLTTGVARVSSSQNLQPAGKRTRPKAFPQTVMIYSIFLVCAQQYPYCMHPDTLTVAAVLSTTNANRSIAMYSTAPYVLAAVYLCSGLVL